MRSMVENRVHLSEVRTFYPHRRVIARPLAGPHIAVDAGGNKAAPVRGRWSSEGSRAGPRIYRQLHHTLT